MRTVNVNNIAGLNSALKSATGDTQITLSQGDYGGLHLRTSQFPNLTGAFDVTITSEDAANPASFVKVSLDAVSNITFDGLFFDHFVHDGSPTHARLFDVRNADNITITNSTFEGDHAQGLSVIDDGFGAGIAFGSTSSTNIDFSGNIISNFYRGAVFSNTHNLTVERNDISDLSSDGLDFSQVTNVLIQDNKIHDFDANPNTPAHMDMIQFFNHSNSTGSSDVTIRGNILDSADGIYAQSIFIKSENGVIYNNFTIEDNFIHNSQSHGISVSHIDGVRITNNTVLHNPDSDTLGTSVGIPKINIASSARNVVVDSNIVSAVTGSGWSGSNNLLAQDTDPSAPFYYGDLFVNGLFGASGTFEDFRAVSGGIIEKMGAGSKYTLEIDTSTGSTTTVTIDKTPKQLVFADSLTETNLNTDDQTVTTADTATVATTEVVVENPSADLLAPGSFANHLTGGEGGNPIKGTSENDWIEGNGGNDKINGGAGDDYIRAGSGKDYFVRGGEGADIFGFGAGDETVKVADFEDGKDKIHLVDGLKFEELKVSVRTLDGKASHSFTSVTGDRLIVVTSVNDTIDETDFITSPQQFQPETVTEHVKAHANGLFGDAYDNPIRGTSEDDWIEGGDGNDKIFGGDGDDYIVAGPGNDFYVRGGFGADIFQFGIGDQIIKIADWEDGLDQIRLVGDLSFEDLLMTSRTYNGVTTTTFETEGGDKILFKDSNPDDFDARDFVPTDTDLG